MDIRTSFDDWPVGKYRVDISIGQTLAKIVAVAITKS
jgi:hypothetical protein